MAIKTYSIDQELAEKFKNQTPEQETSKVLENLIKEYLDEQPDQEIKLDITKLSLTNSQEKLLHKMLERNISKKSNTSMFGLARKNNIYGRSHHFGEGISALVNNEEIPYHREGDKIVASKFNCPGCGAGFGFNLFVKSDGCCPNCDVKAVRLP